MLKLTVLCGEYESVRALRERTVKPKGIELEFVSFPGVKDIHDRVARGEGADINEYNGGAYVMAKSRGATFTSLPVFLHRRFRHGFIFVNVKSGIEKPSDLIGRTMGSLNYTSAAEFWMRGLLEDDYGVKPSDMNWVIKEEPEIPFKPIAGLRMTKAPAGKHPWQMFLKGEIDAYMTPQLFPEVINKDTRIRRLFVDNKATERAYYERTGIFPIMHVTTIKRELVKKEPWVVASLTQAFEDAKRLAYQRVANPRIVPIAWWTEHWEEQQALLGPDPWEYGLGERNLKNYGMLVEYANRQGLTEKKMKLKDLFPKEAFELKLPLKVKYKPAVGTY